eukprot:351853-Chlamydomonas_euryale.AAC.12
MICDDSQCSWLCCQRHHVSKVSFMLALNTSDTCVVIELHCNVTMCSGISMNAACADMRGAEKCVHKGVHVSCLIRMCGVVE